MATIAILIECDPGTSLGGSCFRDVNNMAKSLLNVNNEINIFTTSPPKEIIPKINYYKTQNLLTELNHFNLNYDLLIVLISGHGFQVSDYDGDEIDGLDEAINIGNQMISDDLIYEKIVKGVKAKKMLLFSDTCHSGTMFDLPYQWNGTGFMRVTRRKEEINTTAFSISACSDQQLSMCDIGEKTGFGGSLTTAVLNIDGCLNDLIKGIDEMNREVIISQYNKINDRLKLLSQSVILGFSHEK